MSAASPGNFDFQEQVVRINRMIEESQKFAAEQHKLTGEALKLERDRAIIPWQIVPWQIVATLLGAGAALFGAGAAFVKVIGG